jgi:hypothetical protein
MYVRIYVHTGIWMAKKKLTLSIEGDLLDEVKGIAAIRGRSLSGIVEEYLEYLVFERWAEALGKELELRGSWSPQRNRRSREAGPKGWMQLLLLVN